MAVISKVHASTYKCISIFYAELYTKDTLIKIIKPFKDFVKFMCNLIIL